jgi:hypothetical protein
MVNKQLYLDRADWIKACEKLNLWRSDDTPNMAFTKDYKLTGLWFKNAGEGYIYLDKKK